MMEPWTLVVAGLVALPVLGAIAVIADLFDAYNDLLKARWFASGGVEEEQARHTLWAQVARALILATIANMALFELAGILHRNMLAVFVYAIAAVAVADAFRARRSRKRMIAMFETDGQ